MPGRLTGTGWVDLVAHAQERVGSLVPHAREGETLVFCSDQAERLTIKHLFVLEKSLLDYIRLIAKRRVFTTCRVFAGRRGYTAEEAGI
jgi:hypothetical protein